MKIYVDKEKCVGCSVCPNACETGALKMNYNKAEVEQEKCTQCRACLSRCVFGAIIREN